MLDKETCKLVARIAENLPDLNSAQMQAWMEDPVRLQTVLSALGRFRTLTAVKIGIPFNSISEIITSIESDCYVSEETKVFLRSSKIVVVDKETEVELAVVTPAELGFEPHIKCQLGDICIRARNVGSLLPCSLEMALRLRLQCHQPKGETLFVVVSSKLPNSFEVYRITPGPEMAFDGGPSHSTAPFLPDRHLVLRRANASELAVVQ